MLLALKFIISMGLHEARQAGGELTGSHRWCQTCKCELNCNELTCLLKAINHLWLVRLLLRVQLESCGNSRDFQHDLVVVCLFPSSTGHINPLYPQEYHKKDKSSRKRTVSSASTSSKCFAEFHPSIKLEITTICYVSQSLYEKHFKFRLQKIGFYSVS